MLEDILLKVNKPARYIGREWNVSRKDFERANIKFALCFPDLYEVGMSNLGIRILYGILNNIPDLVCERFFSCNDDLEQILRASGTEIFSLESQRRMKEFDLIGFSLGSELDYTNVLNILDLAGIPLRASGRNYSQPLIIAGGPCALNPEPMHEFFDLFLIGEAEEAIVEIAAIYRKYKEKFKSAKISKEDLLLEFAQVEGVYAPFLYEVIYNSCGRVSEFKPRTKGAPGKIKKRIVHDLNAAYFPAEWLVPYIQIVHDRLTLELMRGCPGRCRFCQARSQYYPLRFRDTKNILNLAHSAYKRTGYEEISLCGLSVSDYPAIEELLQSLIKSFKERAVSVSLPSIKPKAYLGGLSALIATIKKTGLTFAPEAGSSRLRSILAKDFNEAEFLETIEKAYLAGYQHIKLYFMIGLPEEEDNDLDDIIQFSSRVSELRRKINHRPAQVNISINVMIPKPHTPFQWLGMDNLAAIKQKEEYIKNKNRNKKLKLNFHNRDMSFLEAVLSRGDRRLSGVILRAFRKGAKFDAWSNHFNFAAWLSAFQELQIDPAFYLKERGLDEFLPWDFIYIGIDKEKLIQEAQELKPVAIQ